MYQVHVLYAVCMYMYVMYVMYVLICIFLMKILENNICLQTQILNKLARCVNKHRRIVLYVHVMCTPWVSPGIC